MFSVTPMLAQVLRASIVETGISLMGLDCNLLEVMISIKIAELRELTYIVPVGPHHLVFIYCYIPTLAVHDDSDNFVRESVYIGLYPLGAGKI